MVAAKERYVRAGWCHGTVIVVGSSYESVMGRLLDSEGVHESRWEINKPGRGLKGIL